MQTPLHTASCERASQGSEQKKVEGLEHRYTQNLLLPPFKMKFRKNVLVQQEGRCWRSEDGLFLHRSFCKLSLAKASFLRLKSLSALFILYIVLHTILLIILSLGLLLEYCGSTAAVCLLVAVLS